ncbi:MAG: hypothetical protein VB064_07110 [Oscillospiraceae bacterium]|nr:hypothetical protein [Oscillospiraceae bacterium]
MKPLKQRSNRKRAYRESGELRTRQKAMRQMDCRGRTERKHGFSSMIRREPALKAGSVMALS